MTANIIFFSRESLPSALKLPVSRQIHQVHFHWTHDASEADGGVPVFVMQALSEALCARHYVCFISDRARSASKQWQLRDGCWMQCQSRLFKGRLPLIFTNVPQIAAGAFDEGWSTEGQMILILKSTQPVELDAHGLQGMPEAIFRLVRDDASVAGALLPGVDGDFAGLYMRSEEELLLLIEQDLPAACNRTNTILRLQTAAEFTA